MRRTVPVLMAGALLLGCAAENVSNPATAGYLESCSDPDTTPAEALRICRLALDAATLTDEQRALVNHNAGIAAFELGRYGDAIEYQSAAVRLKPDLDAAFVNMAESYERMGDDRAALAGYAAAIRVNPGAREGWFGRGALLRRLGQPVDAVRDLDRALQLSPGWSDAHFERGSAHYALGDYRQAEADFSAVLARAPDDAAALVNRGQARLALRSAEAGADFERAIRLRPEWGMAWYARGRWHEAEGRTEAANADYLRAYELGETDPELNRKVRQLSGG